MVRLSSNAALKQEADAAQQMLRAGLSEWDRVNGLERPYRVDSEAIPERWTPEHLQRRVVEAIKTLDKTQGPKPPRGPGNHWPTFRPDFAVMTDWESMGFSERQDRYADLNFVADRPSIKDITRMEACLSWLQELREVDKPLGVCLTMWAICQAKGKTVTDMCRREGWSFSGFYRRLRQASETMSERLNSRLETVF